MNKDTVDFAKLFQDKKYSLILSIIDKISEDKKNSGLYNLSGVSKMSLSHSNESLESAIKDFRKAYLKEKNSTNAYHALKNFINASMILFDNKFPNNELEIEQNIFEEILMYYDENKDFFEKDFSNATSIIRVFKKKLDIKKAIYHLKKIVEKENTNTDALASLCFHNNFINDWKQFEYLKYSKILNERLTQFSSDDLVNLKIDKSDKIKLGFLSPDIRQKHSVTYFLKTLLKEYDPDKFEINLYLNNKIEDETTNEFKKYVSKTTNITSLNDIEAINKIRNDHLNILIDLSGFSSNHRLVLLKNRLAPIQISWCGYNNTLGIKEVDYLITDKNLIHENEQNEYSEKIVYLPKIWNCHSGYDIKRLKYDPPVNKNDFITFGSFNNFLKINDDVIKVWSSILKNVQNSKLILKTSIPTANTIILEKFKQNGIDNSVEFLKYNKSFEDHLNEYKKIDIALDTFPWNGVTTSFEAIWMGVPVLTMKGFNFNSRCGGSINQNLGLNELIADNQKDYIEKASLISGNKKRLEEIRNQVFDNALESPLFDSKKFSKSFFECMKKIYKK
tara:strand:- start:1279 stop:2964 length:1686 start_codon:yes stop_codon:yes gene_type:complete